ncbi:hypothetical protein [Pseudonocardia hydrocarbonoxydans]|uniref:Uncharacterized protein n=1 Tax=Pseudonocardia hydrocarbonoxydans TaxID=76726 RepID=A0A4Y3WTJ0_9PSEU|nr:hypothetical protein [Pseudonocardia hydrocarbonoxydans]GEC22202.1 hypothetical protein PHY01_44850 [Pseudonocardia hydrocarbonoxydans]
MPIHTVTRPRQTSDSDERYTARLGLIGAIAAVVLSGFIAYAAGAQQSDVDYKRERRDTAYVELLNAHDSLFRIEQDIAKFDEPTPGYFQAVEQLNAATEEYSTASNSVVVIESDGVGQIRNELDACHTTFRNFATDGTFGELFTGDLCVPGQTELTATGDGIIFETASTGAVTVKDFLPDIYRLGVKLAEAMRSDING